MKTNPSVFQFLVTILDIIQADPEKVSSSVTTVDEDVIESLLVCDRVDKHEAVIILVIDIPSANECVLARSVHNLEADGLVVHHVVVLHVRVLDGGVVVVLELAVDKSHGDVRLADTSAPWKRTNSYS